MSICLIGLFEATARHYAGREIAKYEAAYPDDSNAQNYPPIISGLSEFDPREDTYAQWMMAVFGVVATLASIFAVVLLRDTLTATREAVRAADEAVEVTRTMGKVQMRAYISVVAIDFVNKPGTDDLVTIQVKIRNTGQTPAYKVHSEHCVGVAVEINRSGADVLQRPRPGGRPSLLTVAPGNTPFTITPTAQKLRPHGMNIYDALMADKIEIYAWGWTKYEDVFGDQHETTFQWFADKASVERGIGFRPDSVGNANT